MAAANHRTGGSERSDAVSEELEYKEAQDYSKSDLVVTLAKYRQLERGIATLTAERDALKAEQESTLKILKDGTAVHINMLRGTIATPTKEQLLHVIGDQRLCTAQSELSASQQEAERLREELAIMTEDRDSETRWAKKYFDDWQAAIAALVAIREHGKGNSVWASSKESKMAEDALSETPAPVRTDTERRFPMQYGPSIPWSFAELLYVGYSACYGDKQSLEGLAQRGGFGWSEIEHFWGSKSFRAAIDAEIERTKGA